MHVLVLCSELCNGKQKRATFIYGFSQHLHLGTERARMTPLAPYHIELTTATRYEKQRQLPLPSPASTEIESHPPATTRPHAQSHPLDGPPHN